MSKGKQIKAVVPWLFILYFPAHMVTCLTNSEKPVFPSGLKRYKRHKLLDLPVVLGKFQHTHFIFSTIQSGSEMYQV